MYCLKRRTIVCRNIYAITIAFFMFLTQIGIVEAAQTQTSRDGNYYFNELKKSILYVLKQQQTIINRNPDGSVKNKKLEPEAFYQLIYTQFTKMKAGQRFQNNYLKGVRNPEKIAPMLASMLLAGRLVTARSQKIINAEDDGTIRMKKFVPAVFVNLTLAKFTGKTDSYMKQITLGKGQYKQRNSDNQPDSWETIALEKFNRRDWMKYHGYGELDEDAYRYVKPIYISRDCLPCHGLPAGEETPYGLAKEGYRQGEVRGGISVALPVK